MPMPRKSARRLSVVLGLGLTIGAGPWVALSIAALMSHAPGFVSVALADDDDDGGDDDPGGPGGGDPDEVAPDLSQESEGENFGPDDCFEEAMVRPQWLRRPCDEPQPQVRPPVRARAAFAGPAASVARAPVEPPNALPREIVILRASPADIASLQARGFTVISRSGEVARLGVPQGMTTAGALSLARQIAPRAISDYNHIYRPAQVACTTPLCRQRRAIRWPEPPGECRAEATIAMIDTTIDSRHPALVGQKVEIANGVSGGRPLATPAHGTAIAALLVGRNDASVPGLLPRGTVFAVQAFHRSAQGEDIADTFDAVTAIDTVNRRGIKVLNLSFTGPNNRVLADAIRDSIAKGTAVVAAAGNLGPAGAVVYPAGYEAVIAVTAVGDDLRIYRGANRGDYIDFAAPGVDVQVVSAKVATRFETGTSFAAPFVAAALAVSRVEDRAAPVADLVAKLQVKATDLGRPGRDPVFGWGLVQLPDLCK